MVDKEVYEATVEPGSVYRTRVNGSFSGCEFNKMIALLNGLLFQCQTYHYHYAYSPEVMIIVRGRNYTVYIDGDGYNGTLFKQ